jgi:ketosteroid isomerase-like protein
MDIARVMAIYAPDIISFDIEPPLQHVGAEAKRPFVRADRADLGTSRSSAA